MSDMLGWVITILCVFVIAIFIITWYLDVLDARDAERKEAELKWRSIRRGK